MERRTSAEMTAVTGGDDVARSAPDDLLRLDQQVCFALAVAARTVIGLYRPILEPLGLTHPQYLVMLALWERSPLTVRRLGELISLEPATLSPLLKRLEANGLVSRERHPDDDRALAITLTPEGRALRQRALEVPPQVIARLGMPVEALHDLHRSLTAVIAAGAAAGDAGGEARGGASERPLNGVPDGVSDGVSDAASRPMGA